MKGPAEGIPFPSQTLAAASATERKDRHNKLTALCCSWIFEAVISSSPLHFKDGQYFTQIKTRKPLIIEPNRCRKTLRIKGVYHFFKHVWGNFFAFTSFDSIFRYLM